jgi:hypothetical protein
MLQKTPRLVDWNLLAEKKRMPCSVCGKRPADPCHILSVGSGGPDADWNVIPMCRTHHTEQHNKGWVTFADKYLAVEHWLRSRGWKWGSESPTGRLWNPKDPRSGSATPEGTPSPASTPAG